MFVYNQELAQLAREVTNGKAEIVQSKLPKSEAISSEKVKNVGGRRASGDGWYPRLFRSPAQVNLALIQRGIGLK